MSGPQPRELPAYALYGDAPRSPLADRLHCESIAARSRLHDWEIRPHRHAALFQILVVRRGRFEALIDGRTLRLAGPAVVTVPVLAAHGFRFAPDIAGSVFTVADAQLQAVLAGDAALRALLQPARALELRRGDPALRELLAAAQALADELQGGRAWRATALDAALLRLLVALARVLPTAAPAEARPARALAHVRRYQALVDARFREQPRLTELAAQTGITPTQLNRVCRQVLGHPALGVLHARLLLEAQRDLAYTAMSVKQIALDLGFSDAAYFTRFFRRGCGLSPSAWRAQAAAAIAPAR